MMRATAIPALLVLGCAARAPAPPLAAKATPKAAAWHEASVPALGLVAHFPVEPQEVVTSNHEDGISRVTRGMTAEVDGTEYGCFVVDVDTPDRGYDRQVLESYAQTLLPKREIEEYGQHGDWLAVLAAGQNAKGKAMMFRASVAGSAYAVGIVIAKGGQLPQDARRFVDGCRFTMPWRITADVDHHFAHAVPSFALRGSLRSDLNLHHYFLGGPDTVYYFSGAAPREGGKERSEDELLDAVLNAMSADGSRVLLQSTFTREDARGRDVVLRSEDGFMRWQLFITPTYFYAAGVAAKSRKAVDDANARRFFKSLRWSQVD